VTVVLVISFPPTKSHAKFVQVALTVVKWGAWAVVAQTVLLTFLQIVLLASHALRASKVLQTHVKKWLYVKQAATRQQMDHARSVQMVLSQILMDGVAAATVTAERDTFVVGCCSVPSIMDLAV